MDLPPPSGPLTIILGFCLICEATAQVVINEIGAASSDHLLRSHPDGRPRVGWGTSWCEPTFDDADWEEGSTPFGFGVDGIATSLGDEMLGRTPSVYLRRTFSVLADEAALNEPFVLTAQADSGFVAYINGREIARANLGRENGFVYHGQSAFSSAQSDEMLEYTSGMLASEVLQAGQNVLAVQVQNTVPSHINERDQTIDETLKFEATLSIGASAEVSLRVDGWKYRVGHAEPSGGVVDWSQVAHPDVEGDYSDWIELHNTSAEEVDLSGWHLTDDDDQPKLWTFLDNTTIAAGGYLLVLADGNTEMPGDYLHTSFKLSAEGEFLGLSDAAGEFVSQFEGGFPKQYPFLSYGLGANGALAYFDLPTPGVANSGTEIMDVVKKPKFDPAGGVYENTVSVTIASRTEDAVIRYTIDGSEPTEANGTLYEGPISIEPIDDRTGTPIRARAFKEGLSPSADGTQTYLVGIDDAFNTIPTLSLVADSGEAFYKPHGIMSVEGLSTPRMVNEYYMPAMHGRSYERKISMEVLYPDDGTNVQINGGLRVSASAFSRFNFSLGNTDASPWPSEPPQKPSFNLFLRNDYGNDTLNFPFVENFPVRQFRQFRLRAGKNDIVSPFVVDELARRIFTDTGQFGAVGVQHALFVNGSYKGYYNSVARIREPLFQDLYGSGDIPWQVKHIDVWADGSPLDNKLEDTDEWKNLERLLRKDLKDLENYKAVTGELDPVSFADYFIVNVYGATEDWPNNNLVIARELSDVGRWRAYVWDAEVCFGVQSSHSITHDSIATDLAQLDRTPSNDLATVWSHLIRSSEWRLLFADRLQKHFFTPGGGSNQSKFDETY
ncbi:lamin tail domain-containing protein [Verrucomicrobiales bacterium]|nr:lamin tail domain-containing protein [Verrucomicrobiales bacterium]